MLLINFLKELIEVQKFDKIIIICFTFNKNKIYQNEEFLFLNNDILICDCNFDDVEQWIKISKNYLSGHNKIIIINYS